MQGPGSAVCIAPGMFLTARHVVADLDHGLPPQWTVPYEQMWLYRETDPPDAVLGGLLEVRSVNPHTETDLATPSTNLPGGSARWLAPVALSLGMPDVGERVRCYGYDFADAEGPLDAGAPTLILSRRLTLGPGTSPRSSPPGASPEHTAPAPAS